MNTNEIIKKWAEAKYSLKDVTEVSFNLENGAEGCLTCGPEPAEIDVFIRYIDVFIRYDSGNKHKSFNEYYATELINEILDYA